MLAIISMHYFINKTQILIIYIISKVKHFNLFLFFLYTKISLILLNTITYITILSKKKVWVKNKVEQANYVFYAS